MPRTRDLLAFALAAVAFWAGLGSYGLVEPSDARYAEIAREMWTSGDWLFPRLLGIHHFHKPPLIYWLTGAGYALFGGNEWGARACLGFLGILLCTLLWRFARRHMDEPAAAWAVVLAATTPAVIGAGRMLTTDLLLAVCLTLALTGWYDTWSGAGGRRSRTALYVGAGLAFLAKGPVAWLLLLLILLPFALLCRGRGARDGSWGLGWGIPLVLLIALPWYAAVVWKTSGLLSYFLGGQIASRFREGGMGHTHSWLYYLWVFPALGLPWVLFAPRGWASLRAGGSPLALFLGLWALVPPLFFTVPASKLPLYVLPAYPALALLGAACLAGHPEDSRRPLQWVGWLFLSLGTALTVVGLGVVPLRGGDLAAIPKPALNALFLPLALACLAGGAAALGWARDLPHRAALALVLALALLPAWAFSRGDTLPLRSVRTVGRAAALELQPGDVLAEYRDLSAGLPFYAGRLPVLGAIARETQFEEGTAAGRVMDQGEFLALWAGPQRVLTVTRPRRMKDCPPPGNWPAAAGSCC